MGVGLTLVVGWNLRFSKWNDIGPHFEELTKQWVMIIGFRLILIFYRRPQDFKKRSEMGGHTKNRSAFKEKIV